MTKKKWTAKGLVLDDQYRLPHLGVVDDQTEFAEVKAGWNAGGMYFNVHVKNKQQSLWCRNTQMLESDRFMVWVDTRDTHNIHRASRFCHWFLAMPLGGGSTGDSPLSTMLKINRSKEDSPSLNQAKQEVKSKKTRDGYELHLHIPNQCLSGWNPEDQRRIGFNYAVVDREKGWQTLAVGPELPIEEDPSLWQTLELVK